MGPPAEYLPVLCDLCKKAKATLHLTDIRPDGQKLAKHYCEPCAMEKGLLQIQKPSVTEEQLTAFVKFESTVSAEIRNLVCESCGISFVEFRNHGTLGCPNDYEIFREVLTPLLRRAHDGATHHTGKAPRATNERQAVQEIRKVRRQLDEAVAAEDYERAAELRDRIRTLEEAQP